MPSIGQEITGGRNKERGSRGGRPAWEMVDLLPLTRKKKKLDSIHGKDRLGRCRYSEAVLT